LIKKISQNLVSILIGKSFELFLNFFSITLIARYLGVEQYGLFTATVAFVFIISKSIDFGFSQIVFREYSLNNQSQNLLNNALSIRILLLLAAFLLYNIIAYTIKINSDEIIFTNILFFNVIISSRYKNVRDLLEIPFKADLKMKYIMLVNILDNILLLIFVIVAIFFKYDFLTVLILYVSANLPGFLIILYLLFRKFNYFYKFSIEKFKWLTKEALPLFGAVLLTAIYQQFDIILLKNIVSDYEAGIYAAALRIATPLQIVPLALITTVFPLITKERNNNPNNSILMQKLVFKILFTFSFLAFVIVLFKSKELVMLIFGADYIEAALPLIILIASYILFYLNNMTQNLMVIYNSQKYNFYYNLLLVFFDLILIALLISSYLSVGTAVARLISTLIGFTYLIYRLRKQKLLYNFMNSRVVSWCFINILLAYSIMNFNIVVLFFSLIFVLWMFIIYTNFFDIEEKQLILKVFNLPTWIQKLIKI